MDSDNNNQDNTDSADALKDLTAELENLKASDLAAETASDAASAPSDTSSDTPSDTSSDTPSEDSSEAPSDLPGTSLTDSSSSEAAAAAELPDEPQLEVPSGPIVPEEPATPADTPSDTSAETSAEEPAPTEPASEESTPESTPSDSVADFTEPSTEESTEGSEENKEDGEKKELPPLKPAAPVPGSIGSAKSYEDYQTDEANRAEKEADKAARAADRAEKDANTKKTTNTGLILGIVIAAIVVIAAAIFAVVTITSKPKSKPQQQEVVVEPEPEPEPVFSSITCDKILDATELSALGEGAKNAEVTFTVTYNDDKLNDISDKRVIEYDTPEHATASVPVLKSAYESTLSALNLASDPFDSTYPVVDSTLTITHLADADAVTEKNFAIFDLRVDEEGNVQTDINTIKEIYTGKDYTCVIK